MEPCAEDRDRAAIAVVEHRARRAGGEEKDESEGHAEAAAGEGPARALLAFPTKGHGAR